MPEDGAADAGIEVVDIEVVASGDGTTMAESEEAGVSQGAPVGYFDDTPATDQTVSRAVAAQQDLAMRTQALANRAPDLLARLGNLKGDEAPAKKPEVLSPLPQGSAPPQVAPAKPVPAKPAPAKPAPAKPVPTKPAAAAPAPAGPVPARRVPAQPAAVAPPAATEPAAAASRKKPMPDIYHPEDALDRLRALAVMLDDGLIDQDEFDAKKAQILARL